MSENLERVKGTLTLHPTAPVEAEAGLERNDPYNPDGLDLTKAENVKLTLLNAFAENDYEYVANVLGCTLPGLDMDMKEMVTSVFTMPELLPHQEELWRKMKPDINPESKDEVYDFLVRECEWEI